MNSFNNAMVITLTDMPPIEHVWDE